VFSSRWSQWAWSVLQIVAAVIALVSRFGTLYTDDLLLFTQTNIQIVKGELKERFERHNFGGCIAGAEAVGKITGLRIAVRL